MKSWKEYQEEEEDASFSFSHSLIIPPQIRSLYFFLSLFPKSMLAIPNIDPPRSFFLCNLLPSLTAKSPQLSYIDANTNACINLVIFCQPMIKYNGSFRVLCLSISATYSQSFIASLGWTHFPFRPLYPKPHHNLELAFPFLSQPTLGKR